MLVSGIPLGFTTARLRSTGLASASPVTLNKASDSEAMGTHSEPQLNRKYMEFVKLMNIYLNHFPKHEKYAMANRIRNTAYELYDLITEAQKRYHKKTTLTELDITHEKLRMQFMLANELGYFAFTAGKEVKDLRENKEQHRYLAINSIIDELGRMIGGWILKIKEDNRW
jgi:L-lactate utilization protein LutC